MMMNFDALWHDYAVYTPALQGSYTKFAHLHQSTPPLPAGLLPSDLNFINPNTRLFKLRDVLLSAGVIMDGKIQPLHNSLDDMVGHRNRRASYALADSGGFQVLTRNMPITSDWRLAQLHWAEKYFDAAVPLDVPSAATLAQGNRYYGHFDKALRDSVESFEFWERHCDPSVSLVRMLVLQGHTPQQAAKWYEGVKRFRWNGIAWGGAMRFSGTHICRMLRRMDADGLLEKLQHLHFLGTSNIGFALLLTAVRRALEAHLGRPVRVTFDTSTPFQYGHIDRRVILPGIDWSGGRPTLRSRALEKVGRVSDAKIVAPFVGSELGRWMPQLTMQDLRRGGASYQAWDTAGRLLICCHNVEMICRAIIEANQQADLEDALSSPVPSTIQLARQAILDVFHKPETNIRYHARALNLFSADTTGEGDHD